MESFNLVGPTPETFPSQIAQKAGRNYALGI